MRDSSGRPLRLRCSTQIIFATVLISYWFLACVPAFSQGPDSPSFGAFAGAGFQHDGATEAAIQAGGSFDITAPNHWIGWTFEGGYAGAVSNLHGGSALFAFNYEPSWHFGETSKVFPFATGGYAQLFGTGHAVDFGAGIDLRLNPKIAIRFEGRDYLTFTPHQHNFAIRIGIRRYVLD